MEKSDKHLGNSCLVLSLIGWGVALCGLLVQFRDYDAGDFEIVIRGWFFMLFAIPATGIQLINCVAGLIHLIRVL